MASEQYLFTQLLGIVSIGARISMKRLLHSVPVVRLAVGETADDSGVGLDVDLTRLDRLQLEHGRLPGGELWKANWADEADGIDERQRREALEPRPDYQVEHGRLTAFTQGIHTWSECIDG